MTKPCGDKRVLFVGAETPPLREVLAQHDIELLAISEPARMLEILADQQTDALVTDIEVSSIDLLCAVRKRFVDLLIIVTTGFADGYLTTDTQLGNLATTIIAQPYEYQDIALAVRHAFQRQAMSSGTVALNQKIRTRSPHVLVAEDDLDCARLLMAMLQKRGFDPVCVADGQRALEAIETDNFDILLTDIQMPRMNGIELTRQVKRFKPKIPVIVMSANGEVDASLEALRAGAYCYVVKPVNFDELALFMDRAMLSDRLERQLRERNTLLEERTKELRSTLNALCEESDLHQASRLSTIKRLAANVAHELKNPINSISASFFYVRSQIPETLFADKPKITRHCDIVESQIERSKSIIDGMMAFANPDAAQTTQVQVNDLLTETINLSLPAQHRMDVRFELDPELPLVEASESKLKIVFSNLVINAAKAMADEGVLTIATEMERDAGVNITFADTGPGLPASIIHKVFDPFFTTDQQYGGTGLGLAICRETVKQCGGTIRAENLPEGGAVFTVMLPLIRREEDWVHSLVEVAGLEG